MQDKQIVEQYISASEIGEYLYCQRAWWLRRQGLPSSQPEVLNQGSMEHDEMNAAVQVIEQGRKQGRVLLWVGIALFVLWIVFKLFAG